MPTVVRVRRRSSLFLLAAAVLGACASAPLVIPGVPAEIEAPGNFAPVLRWFARGTQNYTCTPRADGSGVEWKLTAPEAALFASDEPNAPQVGSHGAGPSWTALDGSRVVGDATRAKRVPSPEPGSIPWLLVPKKDGDTTGTLAGIEFVQRLNTVGGQPPATGCDASTAGAQVKVPYTATYVFYRAR